MIERSIVRLQSKDNMAHRVLLVDDDTMVLDMVSEGLNGKGFEVVAANGVTEALHRIATEKFDVLITDLHMPNAGDGFTVVTAMRHSQPNALTLLVSGYPDVQSAMDTIVMEADEIIVKPFEVGKLAQLVKEKVLARKPVVPSIKESVSAILQRCSTTVIADWLTRTKNTPELNHLPLTDGERTGHLPKLVEDLIVRLGKPNTIGNEGNTTVCAAAVAHGKLRFLQAYTPSMLIHESRILQVTIFGTLQGNLNSLNFSLLLPDIMTVADEVEVQLTQTMNGFMEVSDQKAVA
jgi:DNA-binding response OmpR family regulator